MNEKELKSKIKEKFGSASRFARIIGMEVVLLHNKIRAEINRNEILKLVEETNDISLEKRELTKELADKIRVEILTKYKRVTIFTSQHPEFTNSWVSNVINQKTGGYNVKRKLLTRKIKKLLSILNIDVNE